MTITEKLVISLLRITGIYHFAIGFLAYFFPARFYEQAAYTGLFNQHFIQDVGAAYITAGSMLILAAFRAQWRLPLSIAGGTFLLLHGLLHLYEIFSGATELKYILMESFTVMLPTILVGYAVYAEFILQRSRQYG